MLGASSGSGLLGDVLFGNLPDRVFARAPMIMKLSLTLEVFQLVKAHVYLVGLGVKSSPSNDKIKYQNGIVIQLTSK